MASESTDSRDRAVSLPGELLEWLDDHAADLDVDTDDLLEQLVSTYRRTAEFGGEDPATVGAPPVDTDAVESIVREVLEERHDDIVEAVADDLEATGASEQRQAEIDALQADFMDKIADVRERVIQVKRETDAKAPADHDHEALDRLPSIADQVESLAADVRVLEAESETHAAESALDDLESTVDDLRATIESNGERLSDAEEKLRTLGWAVSDLREQQTERSSDPLDRIKAAAAGHDISRAVCENCGDGVEIGLMTRPACPHCDAAVTNVEPSSGFFGKPTLVTASQIESGAKEHSRTDVSAAGGERR